MRDKQATIKYIYLRILSAVSRSNTIFVVNLHSDEIVKKILFLFSVCLITCLPDSAVNEAISGIASDHHIDHSCCKAVLCFVTILIARRKLSYIRFPNAVVFTK